MSSKKYLAKKAIITIVTFFLIISINFLLFRIVPGDPERLLFRDPRIREDALILLRKKFGLDKPLWIQFVIYIRNTLQGDLGWSYAYDLPVLKIISYRIPNTILLIGSAFILSTVIGVLLGAIAGWKRGSKTDSILFSFSLIITWLPTFWLGIMLLMVLGFWWRLFPLGGIRTVAVDLNMFERWLDILWHMTLPMITMIFWYFGAYVMLMRSSMLDVLTEDYMLTAKAKGLKESVIIKDYAMRNALLPVVTMTMINLGFIVSGAIQVEVVFSWPGVGRLVYDALMKRDYPLLQGVFLVIAISVLCANFLTDILYSYLDPRVRTGLDYER